LGLLTPPSALTHVPESYADYFRCNVVDLVTVVDLVAVRLSERCDIDAIFSIAFVI